MEQKLGRICVLVGMLAWAVPAGAAPSYTAAQASAGANVFTQNCAMCHGDALQGGVGPALAGPSFATAGNTIGDIFGLISSQMPETAPGSLSNTQYTDVLAFILSKNGYAAGSAALDPTDKATAASTITAQGK